ncbi:hypothetical protein FRC01_010907 [Tulasnella sp. 417]|nr:hypothetical protein FRC01_010907 [Tulasnella sp. 417]
MQGLQRCLGPLLRNVSSCPPITLVVSQSGNVPESDHWWMVDSEINDKVTEIDIRASGEEVFLRFLCTGRLIDGVVKWPFPKLEQLRLGELVSGARVIQFLKRRYTPDIEELARILVPAPQSPLILEMPDQLAILDVDDDIFDRGDYEAYLDIMGARDV